MRAMAHERHCAESGHPENARMSEKAPSICVLEDDAAVRDSLRWMLERNGYSSRTFCTPNEFLMSRGREDYACLIVDLGLPGMSGLELLELLHARASSTPVILIAATADALTETRARKAGASDLLMKPIAPSVLLGALRKAMGGVLPNSAHHVRSGP
jgi:two-component system, LuxR family, response regulator FixJ